MGKVNVIIVDATGNKSQKVGLPDDIKCGIIMVKLIEKINLPSIGPDGNPISYKFIHKATGRQLLESRTLGESGVKDGDTLRLQPEITAGGKNSSLRRFAYRAVTCLLALSMILSLTGCNSSDYNKAVSLYNSGDYIGAADMFAALGDYKDSASQILDCYYHQADEDISSGNYDEAVSYLHMLQDSEGRSERVAGAFYRLVAIYVQENGSAFTPAIQTEARYKKAVISQLEDSYYMLAALDDDSQQVTLGYGYDNEYVFIEFSFCLIPGSDSAVFQATGALYTANLGYSIVETGTADVPLSSVTPDSNYSLSYSDYQAEACYPNGITTTFSNSSDVAEKFYGTSDSGATLIVGDGVTKHNSAFTEQLPTFLDSIAAGLIPADLGFTALED